LKEPTDCILKALEAQEIKALEGGGSTFLRNMGSGLSSEGTSHFRTTPDKFSDYSAVETLKLKILSSFKISQGSCKVIEM
jgi:hypothetical protein